jgi:hypothetical protein
VIVRFGAALVCIAAVTSPATGQDLTPRFYYLNVPIASGANTFSDASFLDIQRIRASASPSWGAFGVDVAYEWVLTINSAGFNAGSGGFGFLGQGGSGTDFLPLQGIIAEGDHVRWSNRIDRLAVSWEADQFDLTVGRQTVSYATTLFLTPTDPFVPFDPADPFRTYRAGVDAVRVRWFPGTFSTIEGVVRPAVSNGDTTVTALARAQFEISGVEISSYAGTVFDDPTVAGGVTVTEAGAAFRGEVQVRRSGGNTVVRFSLGADRNWNVAGRSLYVLFEYQRDGFGAASGDDLVSVLTSPYARRGELQVFGRNEAVLSAQYQVHPLWSVQALTITNFNDPSVLFAPAASYSVSGSVNLRGGLYVAAGSEAANMSLGSEYGNTPFTAYLSLEAFF